ncbi:hypothetical protein ACFDR9_005177 [Janthinobacterium sp. CG_23.3]|uniref:hypothetical protein n=1 Tax=unclassified Janthinobacterium TaxID=2610881 RepID=UPI002DFB91B6|nr:hypothetical protein [Janthinobacterium sp. CG_S6]
MCGGGSKLPPAPDPKVEREKVEIDATTAANAKAADARRSKRSQSLLASGAAGVANNATTSSVLAQGKDKLGG